MTFDAPIPGVTFDAPNPGVTIDAPTTGMTFDASTPCDDLFYALIFQGDIWLTSDIPSEKLSDKLIKETDK